jgi:hypothetical protein
MYSLFEIIASTDDDVVDLVALATLKAAIGIEGITEDSSLSTRITLASGMIAEFCDRTFALSYARETFVFERSDLCVHPGIAAIEALSGARVRVCHC